MGIERLLTALLHELRRRVRNGQLTERGLARLSGVSQPHLHHILKGKRGLTPVLADRMMEILGLDLPSLVELCHQEDAASPPAAVSGPAAVPPDSAHPPIPSGAAVTPIHEPTVLVPILDGLAGPGYPRPLPFRQPRYLPVPRREVPSETPLVAVRMAFDPDAGPAFVPNDLIVIAATPLPPVLAGAMEELSWVLDDGRSWRVEPPPHSGEPVPAASSPAGVQQLELFEGSRPASPQAAPGNPAVAGVVVLCIRRMGPLRLPLLDPLPQQD